MNRSNCAARHGFTLIEVIIAIALFMFGITAILGMFQVGGNLEEDARVHAELAPVLQPLIQQIRREAWLVDKQGHITGIRLYQGEVVPNLPQYRFDLEIDPVQSNPELRKAEIRFYRQSPKRVLARVSFLLDRQLPIPSK